MPKDKNKNKKKKPTYNRGDVETPQLGLEPTPASQWRKIPEEGESLILPSHNVVRCRRPGLEGFLKLGMVPNELIPVVDGSLVGVKDYNPMEMINDGDKIDQAQKFMEDVTMYAVVDPVIKRRPENSKDHEDDVLYLDMVDTEDQSFILQFAVGGTRSVERFRQQRLADVAAVAELTSDAVKAKRSSGDS